MWCALIKVPVLIHFFFGFSASLGLFANGSFVGWTSYAEDNLDKLDQTVTNFVLIFIVVVFIVSSLF